MEHQLFFVLFFPGVGLMPMTIGVLFGCVGNMDKIHFAPPFRNPGRMIPVKIPSNKWLPMVSKWCRILSTHSMPMLTWKVPHKRATGEGRLCPPTTQFKGLWKVWMIPMTFESCSTALPQTSVSEP